VLFVSWQAVGAGFPSLLLLLLRRRRQQQLHQAYKAPVPCSALAMHLSPGTLPDCPQVLQVLGAACNPQPGL
jgi:hypothetical protein